MAVAVEVAGAGDGRPVLWTDDTVWIVSSSIDDGDTIRVSRLDGGLRVVTETLPQSRSVAVGAWVGVGNRDEPAAIAGVSHFLEHLLFKGSSTRSAQDIAQGIDAVGGDLNAFTSKEYTAFHARVPAWELDFGLDTLLDVLADPGFSDAELEAERQVILEELAWSADTPDDVVHGVLAENLFPGHSLGWEVLGSAESVRAITPTMFGLSTISGTGSPTWWWSSSARSITTTSSPGLMPRSPPEPVVPVLNGLGRAARSSPMRRRSARSNKPTSPEAGAAGGLHSDDRYGLAVATQLLGGGWSSRLFQEVREKRGLSYTVFASVGSFVDTGTLSVYAATAPDRLARTPVGRSMSNSPIWPRTGRGARARRCPWRLRRRHRARVGRQRQPDGPAGDQCLDP